jgi:hypothetical protein
MEEGKNLLRQGPNFVFLIIWVAKRKEAESSSSAGSPQLFCHKPDVYEGSCHPYHDRSGNGTHTRGEFAFHRVLGPKLAEASLGSLQSSSQLYPYRASWG